MTTNQDSKQVTEIPKKERKPFLRLIAWLCMQDDELHRSEEDFLLELGAKLELSKKAIDDALDEAKEQSDPEEAARGLHTRWVKGLLVHQLLLLAIVDGHYDARERTGIRRIAAALNVEAEDVDVLEAGIASDLLKATKHEQKRDKTEKTPWTWKRAATVGGLTIGAAGLAAVTGGLAAPAIGGAIGSTFLGLSGAAATSAGLATIGGGSLAAGGLGMAGGTAIVSSALGLGGGVLAARKSTRRTAGIRDFDFISLGGTSAHAVVGVSGFLSQDATFEEDWKALAEAYPHASRYALRWESKTLRHLGEAIGAAGAKVAARYVAGRAARHATKAGATLLTAPAAVLSALDVIDNPWHMARDRAEKSGAALSMELADAVLGHRPVTLVGFSLGSRVILRALEHLNEQGGVGLVHSVYLLGGAASTKDPGLDAAERVVSGEVVNVYSEVDWVLQYLYRIAELNDRPIGLGPVNRPGIVDVDVTQTARGHLDYRRVLAQVLLQARDEADAEAGTAWPRDQEVEAECPYCGEVLVLEDAGTPGDEYECAACGEGFTWADA